MASVPHIRMPVLAALLLIQLCNNAIQKGPWTWTLADPRGRPRWRSWPHGSWLAIVEIWKVNQPMKELPCCLSTLPLPSCLLSLSLSLYHSITQIHFLNSSSLWFILYNHTFICLCIQNNLYKELKYASHLAQNFLIPTLLATCFTMFVLCYKESGATF